VRFVQPIREEKQINGIKAILRGQSRRDYCLFVLGINSGLRIGDLLALKVDDVVDARGKVRDRISVREKKTGKVKDFPIGGTTEKAIKEYLGPSMGDIDPDRALFPSRKGGGPLTRQHAWRIIVDAARAVGITEPIGTHTLRKTFGYHAYKQGVDITRIQKLLNHSSPSVTLAYIGITQDELDNIYLTMNL